MPDLYVSRVISAPLEGVWEPIRTFTDVQFWFPGLTEMHIANNHAPDQVGAVRKFLDPGDEWLEEKLLALSDQHHHQAYRKLRREEPIRDYVGHMKLHPVTAGEDSRTFVEWWVELDVDPAHRKTVVEQYSAAFERGLEGLSDYLNTS